MNIKDYLKYYVGQQCQTIAPDGIPHSILETINYYWLERSERDGAQVILILRKLEDITEEEMIAGGWNNYTGFQYYMHHNAGAFHPSDFHYLISKGFDLFGLIPAGLAIDSATLTNK